MEIHYSKQAEKFLKKQTASVRKRIRAAIHSLPAGDVKKWAITGLFLTETDTYYL